jgi:hypothetical protein
MGLTVSESCKYLSSASADLKSRAIDNLIEKSSINPDKDVTDLTEDVLKKYVKEWQATDGFSDSTRYNYLSRVRAGLKQAARIYSQSDKSPEDKDGKEPVVPETVFTKGIRELQAFEAGTYSDRVPNNRLRLECPLGSGRKAHVSIPDDITESEMNRLIDKLRALAS